MSRRTPLAATATAAVLLVALTGCSFSLGTPTKASQTTAPAVSEASEAPVDEASDEPTDVSAADDDTQAVAGGGTVSAGTFDYDVASVANIGNVAGGTVTASGTYLLVDLSVTNTSAEPKPFFDTYVKLVDASGTTYDADLGATDATTGDPNVWLDDIAAGATVTNVLVYDIPEGTRIVSAELTDDMTGETQTVTLN